MSDIQPFNNLLAAYSAYFKSSSLSSLSNLLIILPTLPRIIEAVLETSTVELVVLGGSKADKNGLVDEYCTRYCPLPFAPLLVVGGELLKSEL